MKAVGGLFGAVATHGNVRAAAWRAARGKMDRGPVRAFLAGLDRNVHEIVRELATGDFRFGTYAAFAVRDPKTRMIHAPSFRDRVVHHAMMAVLGPVMERGAMAHSYACRAGMGMHLAVRQVRQWARRRGAFLKADVHKYYDSVAHEVLRAALARRFREKRVLALFDRLLESYAHHPGHGLPIGALTSQYLGNFHLDPVDHWVQQHLRPRHYARYMDDMLLMDEPERLPDVRDALAGRLGEYGLSIKHGGVINHDASGIPWLGFTVYPDRIRLNAAGRRRLRLRLRVAERAGYGEPELQARVTALFAHAMLGDDAAWRREACRFSRFGDRQETAPRDAGRVMEQPPGLVPCGDPQQEAPGQPQQEPWLPGFSGPPRYDGMDLPPDDACSCAPAAPEAAGDQPMGKSPPAADSDSQQGLAKAAGGAPVTSNSSSP